jgi:hypothetical protein
MQPPTRLGAILLATTILASTLAAQDGWRQEAVGAQFELRLHNSESFDGSLWVFSGRHYSAGSNRDVWSSENGSAWNLEGQAAFAATRSKPSVVHAGKVWLFGVGMGETARSHVWSTADGLNWKQETDSAPWTPRDDHSAVVFNNRMWILGGGQHVTGWFDPLPLNDVWSSADGINWTQEVAAAAWPPRTGHESVVFDGRMWVIGGYDVFPGDPLNDVWSSGDGINWRQETAVAPWGPRFMHTATVYDNRVWVIGGREAVWNVVGYGDVWSSADGVNWRFEGEPWLGEPYPKSVAHAATVHKGRLWVIGGTLDAVWSYGIHGQVAELPNGRVDLPYVGAAEVYSTDGEYTWTHVSGDLPPGLSFGTSTTRRLPISGTPAEAGLWTFTMRIEVADETFEQEYSLRIWKQPSPLGDNDGGCVLGSVPPAPAALALLCAVTAILRRRK